MTPGPACVTHDNNITVYESGRVRFQKWSANGSTSWLPGTAKVDHNSTGWALSAFNRQELLPERGRGSADFESSG